MANTQPTEEGGPRAGGKGAGRMRARAEGLAATFPHLLVEAEHLANTIVAGEHGRRRSGTGETFWQFRNFRDGDSRAAIDWRRSARSQSLYVRETEWELAQSVWIWLDRSASMDFQSKLATTTKAHSAAVLSLALAILLMRGGERVGDITRESRARAGETALNALTLTATETPSGHRPLPPVDNRLRRANMVMVSDFLRPATDVAAFIREASAQGAHGHVLQVLDPAEEAWPFEGRILFEGVGAGESLLTGRAEVLRKTYKEKLARHRAIIADAARKAGWSFKVHHTDTSPQSALLALYARLSGEAEIMHGARP